MNTIRVAVAGSTQHTALLAETLRSLTEFELLWVVTPVPKPIGREQTITENPLHQWAVSNQLPVVTVEKKIDEEVKKNILALSRPDILLVVDFGYMIPDWLLEHPTIAPVNVHPSVLPEWRGSSPGQFVLLSGATASAVSILVVTAGLDSGPLLHQEPFTIHENWTQTEYYAHSFALAANILPEVLKRFAEAQTTVTPQPETSPTPIARRLSKDDSFVSWDIIKQAMHNTTSSTTETTISGDITHNPLMARVLQDNQSSLHPIILERASRAFAPWPMLWTLVETSKGPKRMQIIECEVSPNGNLQLNIVKIEGLPAKPWPEVKNQINQ